MVPLCRYAFLSIVVASMGTAQSAWLFKNLRAKQIAKASMAAITLSGCAGAIRGFFYPFIFAWHCSQFDME